MVEIQMEKNTMVGNMEMNGDGFASLTGTFAVWVFHPNEPIRTFWEVLISFLMLIILITMPIKICFMVQDELKSDWSLLELVVDVFFLTDIVFTFNTGYFQGTFLITDRRKIAIKYVSSWFCADLATSVPFDWLIGQAKIGRIALILKIVRVARLVKLLRLVRLISLMTQWENSSTYWTAALRALKLLTVVFISAHIAACFFVGVANYYRSSFDRSYENYYGYHQSSWVVRFQYTWELNQSEQYLRSLYWAFTTLATVGYGDITPLLPLEIILTIFVQICGSSLFGYIIGNVASLITRDDETQLLIKGKIKSVSHYIRYRNFPEDISKKIKRHFEYSWKQNQVSKEGEILSDMPQGLRAECALFIHRNLISRVPFLSNLGPDVAPSLVTRLRPLLCFRGDVIIQEGLFGNEMFFISEGEVEYLLNYRRSATKIDQIEIGKLSTGEYFGGYAVIMDQAKHPATIIAQADCDLHVLPRQDFVEFGQEYPLVYFQIISTIKARYMQLMKSIITKRQWHAMKLNVLMFDKADAKARGEDPDELTITPQFVREQYANIATKRASVTTIGQRLAYKRRLEAQIRANTEAARLTTWVPFHSKYASQTMKRIFLGKKEQNQVIPREARIRAESTAVKERKDSRLVPIFKRKKFGANVVLSSSEVGLDKETETVDVKLFRWGSNLKALSNFGKDDSRSGQDDWRSVLSQCSSIAPDFEEKMNSPQENVALPWWILVKVLSWKNRAQLSVALRSIEVVEKRHCDRYNILKRNNTTRRKSSLKVKMSQKASHLWDKATSLATGSKEYLESVRAFKETQNATREEIKDLQDTLEDLRSDVMKEVECIKNEFRNTTRLLFVMAKEMQSAQEQTDNKTAFENSKACNCWCAAFENSKACNCWFSVFYQYQ